MGWLKKQFRRVRRVFKKVAKVATFGAYHDRSGGGGAVEAPTPAPAQTQQLGDTEGSAEKEKVTKAKARKGKKALKIESTGVGRNIV